MEDMDLVVLIDDPTAGLEPSHLVQMMGDLLERVSMDTLPTVAIREKKKDGRRVLSST